MSLNMPENTWINFSDYARVLNMPEYIYNNIIIIVGNVIILEFLSTRFGCKSRCSATILSF